MPCKSFSSTHPPHHQHQQLPGPSRRRRPDARPSSWEAVLAAGRGSSSLGRSPGVCDGRCSEQHAQQMHAVNWYPLVCRSLSLSALRNFAFLMLPILSHTFFPTNKARTACNFTSIVPMRCMLPFDCPAGSTTNTPLCPSAINNCSSWHATAAQAEHWRAAAIPPTACNTSSPTAVGSPQTSIQCNSCCVLPKRLKGWC